MENYKLAEANKVEVVNLALDGGKVSIVKPTKRRNINELTDADWNEILMLFSNKTKVGKIADKYNLNRQSLNKKLREMGIYQRKSIKHDNQAKSVNDIVIEQLFSAELKIVDDAINNIALDMLSEDSNMLYSELMQLRAEALEDYKKARHSMAKYIKRAEKTAIVLNSEINDKINELSAASNKLSNTSNKLSAFLEELNKGE